jgi:hypothetical protein
VVGRSLSGGDTLESWYIRARCFFFGSSLGPLLGGVIRLLHVSSVVKWLNRSVLRNKGPYRDLEGSENSVIRFSKVVVSDK